MPRAPRTGPRRRRVRVRRAPEEARVHLLAAAERVFGRYMPDEVGLRHIAAEAAVSHALITHYFGTYEALCEAVLDRRLGVVRARMLEHLSVAGPTTAAQILGPLPALVDLAGDRLTVRLLVWAITSGRARRPGFITSRVQGLRLVVDGIERALAARGGPVPSRARLELAVATGLAMTLGHAIAGDLVYRALGHTHPPDPAVLVTELAAMISAYLAARAD